MTEVSVEIDLAARTAYATLTDQPVARTIEVTGRTLVDVDALGVVVGIEFLGETWDVDEVIEQCHVPSAALETVRMLRNPLVEPVETVVWSGQVVDAVGAGQLVAR